MSKDTGHSHLRCGAHGPSPLSLPGPQPRKALGQPGAPAAAMAARRSAGCPGPGMREHHRASITAWRATEAGPTLGVRKPASGTRFSTQTRNGAQLQGPLGGPRSASSSPAWVAGLLNPLTWRAPHPMGGEKCSRSPKRINLLHLGASRQLVGAGRVQRGKWDLSKQAATWKSGHKHLRGRWRARLRENTHFRRRKHCRRNWFCALKEVGHV